MKRRKKEVEVVTNVEVGNTFTINTGENLFSVLSGMYSNIHSTIIREYACNARDAHIELSSKKKKSTHKTFDLKLPTLEDPIFCIRDYGVGISKENMSKIYFSYASSTKSNSNRQIGTFGLGSKCAFAYVNDYVVTSYYDGMEYGYLLSKENGVPSYSLVSEKATTEPNGLKIEIACLPSDCKVFEKSAIEFFTYFDMKPNWIGYKPKIPSIKYFLTEGNVKLINSYSDNPINLIMGGVCYPLSSKDVTDHIKSPQIKQLTSDYTFDIYVNIGDVHVVPSREKLDFSYKVTADTINSVLDSFMKNLSKSAQNHISGLKSLSDCYNYLRNEYGKKTDHISKIITKSTYNWNNHVITSKFSILNCYEYSNYNFNFIQNKSVDIFKKPNSLIIHLSADEFTKNKNSLLSALKKLNKSYDEIIVVHEITDEIIAYYGDKSIKNLQYCLDLLVNTLSNNTLLCSYVKGGRVITEDISKVDKNLQYYEIVSNLSKVQVEDIGNLKISGKNNIGNDYTFNVSKITEPCLLIEDKSDLSKYPFGSSLVSYSETILSNLETLSKKIYVTYQDEDYCKKKDLEKLNHPLYNRILDEISGYESHTTNSNMDELTQMFNYNKPQTAAFREFFKDLVVEYPDIEWLQFFDTFGQFRSAVMNKSKANAFDGIMKNLTMSEKLSFRDKLSGDDLINFDYCYPDVYESISGVSKKAA